MVGWLEEVRGTSASRPLAPVRRRLLDNGLVDAGFAADGRRRWRVSTILDNRGRGRRAEARVSWEGADPATGKPWDDEWIRVSQLTKDLRELVGLRTPPVRRATPVPFRKRPNVQGDGAPARKSPRSVIVSERQREEEAAAVRWKRIRLRVM
jgi:hypothetical protein